MKAIRAFFFNFLILTLLPNIALANTLQVESVIHSINDHFPEILAAQADIAKSHANLLSARGGFDPIIKSRFVSSTVGVYKNLYSDTEISAPISNSGNRFFTGYRLGRGDFPVYDQGMWTYNQGEVRAGFEIPLLRNRSIDDRRAKILVSKSSLKISEKELDLKKLQALRDGIFSYWDWYLEGNKFIIQKKLLQLAEDRQTVIQHRLNKGDIPQLDLIENQRIIMQRKIFLAQQKQSYQKAALLLSLYFRDKKGNPIVPDISQLPRAIETPPEIETAFFNKKEFSSILEHHPLMEQYKEKRNISFIDLSLAENSLKPNLSNRIYFARDFGPGNPPLNRTSLNFELLFELPINQRQARGNINAAKSLLARVDQDQKMFVDRLAVNIAAAKNQIHMMNQVISLTKQELGAAKRLESAEKTKYNHGDSNLFLINLREQSTVETEIRLLSALVDINKAREEYLYSIGYTQN